MLNRFFKVFICTSFVLIFTVKTLIPVTAVFISHFIKQEKTLVTDQDNDDEKTSEAKDLIGKTKKNADEAIVSVYEFVPFVTRINLLYKQQDALFKQTHFPAVLTPPPNQI